MFTFIAQTIIDFSMTIFIAALLLSFIYAVWELWKAFMNW